MHLCCWRPFWARRHYPSHDIGLPEVTDGHFQPPLFQTAILSMALIYGASGGLSMVLFLLPPQGKHGSPLQGMDGTDKVAT